MKTIISATFPLFSLALGAVNWSALESCVTESATSSVKSVSTSISTTTVHQPDVIVKHTFHPKHYVTPLPFTRTWTHTFHETDTAVSTVTVTLTSTELVPTSTIISTATKTNVSNVYTTIAAPSGFLPISNTSNSAYPAVQSVQSTQSQSQTSAAASITSFSAHNASSSSLTASASASASVVVEARSPKGGHLAQEFAHIVHCLKSVLVQKTVDSTITGATQTSTLSQATSTLTVSTTTTTMVKPKFGHGKTVYTTAWTTVTKNINVHSTQTVSAEVTSTVKAYAACQTNNLLASVVSVSAPSSEKISYKTTVASSAKGCCEQCMETSDCVGSAYQQLLPLGGRCLIYYSKTCPFQSANSLEYFTTSSKSGAVGSFVVSNGLCGYMYTGGQVSTHGHGTH